MNDNSKEAYSNIKPRLGLIQEQIMSHLPDIDCHLPLVMPSIQESRSSHVFTKWKTPLVVPLIRGAATCAAIAHYCKLTEDQTRKRMSELERAGLVERCKEKFQYVGADGRRYSKTIWRIKEHE